MNEYVFGLHAARKLLQNEPQRALELLLQQERHDNRLKEILQYARQHGLAVNRVPPATLNRLSEGGRHQGVVLRCRPAVALKENDLEQLLDGGETETRLLFLVLDGVQDPHNLGACLRTADAAGARGVIVPRDRAAGLSPTARKVACGAAESVPFFQVANLARALELLKSRGIWLVGTAGEAETELFQADLAGPLALVLGAEEKGLRRLTREHCDLLVSLPMRGQVESLNVSVAAGICLYEALRQGRG